MSEMLQEGLSWLADELKEHNSREVTYRDGGQEVKVKATIGRMRLQLSDEFGGRIITTDRDYFLKAADLVLAGVQVPPAKGAEVLETVGTKREVHAVLSPGGDEPHWRWADPYHIELQLHTKLVRTEL